MTDLLEDLWLNYPMVSTFPLRCREIIVFLKNILLLYSILSFLLKVRLEGQVLEKAYLRPSDAYVRQ